MTLFPLAASLTSKCIDYVQRVAAVWFDTNLFSYLEDRIKAYNYNNIKTALEEGLDSIRGFQGDIRLSAK